MRLVIVIVCVACIAEGWFLGHVMMDFVSKKINEKKGDK